MCGHTPVLLRVFPNLFCKLFRGGFTGLGLQDRHLPAFNLVHGDMLVGVRLQNWRWRSLVLLSSALGAGLEALKLGKLVLVGNHYAILTFLGGRQVGRACNSIQCRSCVLLEGWIQLMRGAPVHHVA